MIRPARPDEAEALAGLVAETPGAPGWTAGHFRHMLGDAAAAHVVWVRVVAERVVGLVALSVHPPEAELELIAVRPEWQGRGWGGGLLEAALHEARRLAVETVHLEVRAGSPAVRLYGRHGFVETGRRVRYYSQPTDDAVLMQWSTGREGLPRGALSGIIEGAYGS